MATEVKKTATKKTITTNTPVVTEKVVEVPKKVEEVKGYEPTDSIPCESVTAGKLMMIGKKTGTLYVWNGVTDVTDVEYQDLKAEILVKGRYLTDPLIIIRDDDLLATKEFS